MGRHRFFTDRKKEKVRRVVDVAILVAFFLVTVGVFYGYTKSHEAESLNVEEGSVLRGDTSERPDMASGTPMSEIPTDTADALLREEDPSSPQEDAPRDEQSSLASESSSAIEDTPAMVDATTSSVVVGVATGTAPRFEDVTTTRYENTSLGFIMELPDNWKVLYESTNEVALTNYSSSYGSPSGSQGTQWITIRRPCTSTVATTSIFVFSEGVSGQNKIAVACVPPLLIELGLRADEPDVAGNERFLQNIARTIYPIVSSVAPYVPIR